MKNGCERMMGNEIPRHFWGRLLYPARNHQLRSDSGSEGFVFRRLRPPEGLVERPESMLTGHESFVFQTKKKNVILFLHFLLGNVAIPSFDVS
jgi:hypothetical protein